MTRAEILAPIVKASGLRDLASRLTGSGEPTRYKASKEWASFLHLKDADTLAREVPLDDDIIQAAIELAYT